MANRVYDQFDDLRRLIAAQHRDCAADKEGIRAARAAIQRSRHLLEELDAAEGRYTKPFIFAPRRLRDPIQEI